MIYIDGELAYPIWRINVKWIQDGNQSQYPKTWWEGLPEGKFYNSTSYYIMYKEPKSYDEIYQESVEWFNKYKNNDKLKDKNVSDEQIMIEFIRYETWCGQHFNHYTYDTGQTDEEILVSFEKFVQRMEILNLREGKEVHFRDGSGSYWQDVYCLMGAEDRWRWSGGNSYENRTDPPCRCDGCKKYGLIRINH